VHEAQFFCVIYARTGSIAGNVNFYRKHVNPNLPKFSVSAHNQTTEGLFKNLHTNKL